MTHDQEEALSLSDRIAVFNQGKVLQVGLPKELYERPASRFVADFIGTNNMIEGAVRSVEAAQHVLEVETPLGDLHALPEGRLKVGDHCILCIRPENAALNHDVEGEDNALKGKVAFSAYLGNTLRYDVEVAAGVIFKVDIRDPWHHQELPVGSSVTLSFPVSSTLAIPAG